MTDYTSDSITTLTPQEHLRLRAGMYTHTGTPIGLFNEAFNNSIDEHLNNFGSKIEVWLSDDGASFSVQDYGRGIPIDCDADGVPAVRRCFLELYSGGKFNNQAYKTSAGLHGVGASLLGILATTTVQVARGGYTHEERYDRGRLVEPLHKLQKVPYTGTKVHVTPDPEIFDSPLLEASTLEGVIEDASHLFPNCEFQFQHKDSVKVFKSAGIQELIDQRFQQVRDKAKQKKIDVQRICDTIAISGEAELDGNETSLDLAFTFTNDWNFHCKTFVNGLYTPLGGTHETAIKKLFFQLLQKYYVDASKYSFSLDDLYTGTFLILHYRTGVTSFSSQTKEKFTGKAAYAEIQASIENRLINWFKANPDTLKRVFTLANQRYEARRQSSKLQQAASNIKLNLGSKLKRGSIQGLVDCSSTDVANSELILLEGDSAMGSARAARYREFQALLPLQGKLPNAYRWAPASILANNEIKLFLNSLGCGYGKACNPELSRYGRVMILSDADPDGSHICSLIISFCLCYLRPLVERGMIYKINAPLYCATKGSTRIHAMTYDELQEKLGPRLKEYNLVRSKGWGETNPDVLREIAMNPETRSVTQLQLTDLSYHTCENLMGSDTSFRKELLGI